MSATLQEIRDSYGLKPKGVTARHRFKRVVVALHNNGHMPTPSNIRYCIFKAANPTGQGNTRGGPNLNGREAKWRREILLALGYTRADHFAARWQPPGGWHRPA